MYQKIILAGNLGKDPEKRYMSDGTPVTNFSVATNRRWTDKASGDTREETTWFRISVWGPQAETAEQYLKKGRQVLIEGRMRPDPATGGPRMWQGDDGEMRASYEVTADVVKFIGSRDDATYTSDEGGKSAVKEEEEIPF